MLELPVEITDRPMVGRHVTMAGECLTATLIVATYAAWATLTLHWQSLPLPLLAAAGGYCLTLFSSLQHEVIHGHPTPNRRLNLSLVWLPLTLWLPLSIYDSSHRAHHRNELTRPGVDPESWYVPAERWATYGPAARALLTFNHTFAGRMLVGPWIAVFQLWHHLLRAAATDGATRRIVLVHAIGMAAVLWWVTAVAGMPAWLYLLAFVWPGISLAMVRAFVEHRYDADPDRRTAIVRGGPMTRLAFLNNNYHWLHHDEPGLAWYLIPSAYRRASGQIAQANGGFEFGGYGAIARRFLLRPWTPPVFPETRAR